MGKSEEIDRVAANGPPTRTGGPREHRNDETALLGRDEYPGQWRAEAMTRDTEAGNPSQHPKSEKPSAPDVPWFVWKPKRIPTRDVIVRWARQGDDLTLCDLIGDGTGPDAWLLKLSFDLIGGGRLDMGSYVEGLTRTLDRQSRSLGRLFLWVRDLETFNPDKRCLDRFEREYQQSTLDVLRGRKPWPRDLELYKDLREWLWCHGTGEYREPLWLDPDRLGPRPNTPLAPFKGMAGPPKLKGAMRVRRPAQ